MKPQTKCWSYGYYDGLKKLRNLDGIKYYVNPQSENYFTEKVLSMKEKDMLKITKALSIATPNGCNVQKIFLEKVIPYMGNKLLNKEITTYKEFIYGLVEWMAKQQNIERFYVYDFEELLSLTIKNAKLNKKVPLEEAIYRFVTCL